MSQRCHSRECAAGLQQQECGLGWKGRERELGFHAADRNGSPSIFNHVYFFNSCKLVVLVFFNFPFRPQQLLCQNVIPPIHLFSTKLCKVKTFAGHVHGSQRTISSFAVVPCHFAGTNARTPKCNGLKAVKKAEEFHFTCCYS